MAFAKHVVAASILAIPAALALSAPASALSTRECSVKYQAAKSANTLNGLSWQAFRKAECGADATAESASPPTAPGAPAPSGRAARNAPSEPSTGSAVFPSAISPQFSNQSAGKQRFHTCLAQYNANKANGGNGGMKWIAKGGNSYYSECNRRLKGA